MKVQVTIDVYEREGKDVPVGVDEKIIVQSHWNLNGPLGNVVLIVDGKSYAVSKGDLEKAINRCVGLS